MSSTSADNSTTLPPNLPQPPHTASLSEEDRPTAEILAQAGTIPIYDQDGKEIKFGDLYSKKHDQDNDINLIIFIRHFYCGSCQSYISVLSESITHQELSNHTPKINISIIGLGSHNLIKQYVDATKCPYAVYSEPTQKLHNALGLRKTFQLGKKPNYERQHFLSNLKKSVVQNCTWGGLMKGGDIQQVGGEFIFVGGVCIWCHRMETVRDHIELDELRKVLGLDK